MNRIIINENDLTSNVEALSSYDVVYVPGFGSGDNKYYREPTLFTSKYDFQREIGSGAVSFASDQYYDINKWDKNAIPDGGASQEHFDRVFPEDDHTITEWTWEDGKLQSITFASPEAEEGQDVDVYAYRDAFLHDYCVKIGEHTKAVDGGQYLVLDSTSLTLTTDYPVKGTELPDNYYTCSPNANEWYIAGTEPDTYIPPVDDQGNFETIITLHGGTGAPQYYYLASRASVMFEAGCPEPGYRYAKLLLSMGIPVYYEQMNSAGELTKYKDVDQDTIDMLAEEYGIGRGKIWEENPKWQTGSTEFNRFLSITDKTKLIQGRTYYVGTPVQVDALYEGLNARFAIIDTSMTKEKWEKDIEIETPSTGLEIDNMGDYTIKFFTTGGYPVFEYGDNGLAETMMEACTRRSDAIVLVDHTNNPDRPIVASNSKSVSFAARNWELGTIAGSYAAMFTPWYECSSPIVLQDYSTTNDSAHYLAMPASLAYLTTLARQIRDYNPWLAVSGVSRGQVPYLSKLHINRNLTNNIADSYQQVPQDGYTNGKGALRSINPITNIRNYGHCIWGNRTLRHNSEGTKATSFLSTRNQISDIKKCIYETSQKLLFEQNSDILWINWKSYVTPLLDSMITNNILRDYTITRYNIDPESGERVPAYKILAAIRIVPINAVEQFELTINIENDVSDVITVDVSENS